MTLASTGQDRDGRPGTRVTPSLSPVTRSPVPRRACDAATLRAMSARLAPVLGLVAGLVVVAAAFAAIFAFLPEPVPATPAPSSTPAASDAPTASARPSASATASPSGDVAFMIGEPAPPLVVPQLGGGTLDLAALEGAPVWLNFMATWCPPCRDELPLMTAYAEDYAERGLVVVAVDVREDEATVSAFMAELGVTFPVGLDEDGAAQAAWGALALPVHYWIDAEGIIRDGALGGIGPDVMEAGIEAILSEPGPSPSP